MGDVYVADGEERVSVADGGVNVAFGDQGGVSVADGGYQGGVYVADGGMQPGFGGNLIIEGFQPGGGVNVADDGGGGVNVADDGGGGVNVAGGGGGASRSGGGDPEEEEETE